MKIAFSRKKRGLVREMIGVERLAVNKYLACSSSGPSVNSVGSVWAGQLPEHGLQISWGYREQQLLCGHVVNFASAISLLTVNP